MKIKYEITKDQCYCSFGDGTIYEFVNIDAVLIQISCYNCSFRWQFPNFDGSVRCFLVPCQKNSRDDKKDGFWRISKSVDYEAFVKLDRIGG